MAMRIFSHIKQINAASCLSNKIKDLFKGFRDEEYNPFDFIATYEAKGMSTPKLRKTRKADTYKSYHVFIAATALLV